jgi:MscS family membrane protein
VSRPLTVGFGVVVARLALPSLSLPANVEHTFESSLGVLLLAVVFWTLARAVDVGHEATSHTKWAANHQASRTLLPLGARIAKVALVLLAVIAVVAQLGVPVASLIAGLGIGGLALALAGQKTVENLFGAFAIGLDQPLREGDVVKVDNVQGTVESIGLRSTRIRTLDRTLIAIPNGKLSEMQIESFSERDRIRLNCKIGLDLDTKAVELRQVLEGFERVLREHPAIWEDTVIVRLLEIGDSALEIEIMAWFRTQSFDEFRLYRQEVLLDFMHVVEDAGTSISSPSTTVTLVKPEEDDRAPRSRPAHIGRHRA